jgi:hypothetical protein
MSVSFWISPNENLSISSARQEFLHKKQDSTPCSTYGINYGDASGSVLAAFHHENSICGGGSTPPQAIIYKQSDFLQNQWYHIVVTFDNAGPMAIYINGDIAQESYNEWNSSVSIRDSKQPLNIGRRPDGNYYFNGIMDDIRIYNRTLSYDEIQEIFNKQPLEYLIGNTIRTIIIELPDEAFKNNASQRKNAFSNKLLDVIETLKAAEIESDPTVQDELYNEAISKLENDILGKMDGFWGGGSNNDWITDSYAQDEIYPLITDAINEIQYLIGF